MKQAEQVNLRTTEAIIKAVESIFPIRVEKDGHVRELHAKNIRFAPKIASDDYKALQEIKLKRGTYNAYLTADLTLYEDGKKIDEAKDVFLAAIPYMTGLYTYIVKGNEYVIPFQLRLKSGAYSRKLPDGTFMYKFNIEQGENFSIIYDPKDVKLRIVLNNKSYKLIPFLRALGITDSQMARYWGKEIFELLKASDDGTVNLEQFASDFFTTRYKHVHSAIPEDLPLAERLKQAFSLTKIDPKVSKITLGVEKSSADVEALLIAVKNLIAMARGEQEPSGMSSLLYKKLYTPDDHMADKAELMRRLMLETIKDRMFKYDKVEAIVTTGYYSKPFTAFITGSSAVQLAENANPIAILANMRKVSLTGEGAIEEERAITLQDRSVDPYYLNFIDLVHTPESDKIGAVMFLANNVSIQHGSKEIHSRFYNVRTKQMELLTPVDVYDKYIAFPEFVEMERGRLKRWKPDKEGLVSALYKGKVVRVKPEQVDLIIPDAEETFGPATASIPFLDSLHGNRAMMAAKHLTHAIAIAEPDRPLVTTEKEMLIGKLFNVYSPVDGYVSPKTNNNEVVVVDNSGKEYRFPLWYYYPTLEGNFITHKLVVKPGDRVTKGQLLASTNFSDETGLRLGKNLRVAYMPYKGYNFEDGFVVSESAARKLASEHVYVEELELEKEDARLISPSEYRALFPGKASMEVLSRFEPTGLPKKGAKFKYGEPILLAVSNRRLSLAERTSEEKYKQSKSQIVDKSLYWDYQTEGEVLETVLEGGIARVVLRTIAPLQVGDKLVARHGNKGTVALIVPDEEMPRDEEGNVIEVIYNPVGVPSRINPSQLLEAALGKIAAKTGKQYVVKNFDNDNNVEFVLKELEKHGLKDKERLTDPHGEPIDRPVFVGVEYFVRLPQRSELKTNIREEWGYDADLQPLRGSEEGGGARAIDPLTFYALSAAGAKKNLEELGTYKASKNDEFWLALELGKVPPAPQPTFAFKKFIAYLKAAGINVEKKGDRLLIRPLNDEDIRKLNPVEIKNPGMFKAHTTMPEEGGLFDIKTLGGVAGKKWGVVNLPIKVLNPVYDDAVRLLLGISTEQLKQLKEGQLGIDKDGNLVSARSKEAVKVGQEALLELVKQKKDVDLSEIKKRLLESDDPKLTGNLAKQLRILAAIKDRKIDPLDFFTDKILVLPPEFRTALEVNGTLVLSPVNYAYRDLIIANNQLKQIKEMQIADDKKFVQMASRLLSRQLDKLMFSTRTETSQMEPKGLITTLTGYGTPKSGLIHAKLFKKRVELSSTGVVQNGPELDLDEVAIPKKMAFELYKPFIIRRLVNYGFDLKTAKEHVSQQSEMAMKALEEEMKIRPVIVNRPPSLHKFNTLAMFPKIIETDDKKDELVVRLNPLVMKGYNADNDGDTVAVHVPATEEARQEAIEKLLPSKHLIKPGTRQFMPTLRNEYVGAIYRLTKLPPNSETIKRVYNDYDLLFEDWVKRRVQSDDLISFEGQTMTVGRALVNGVLPRHWRKPDEVWDGKKMAQMLTRITMLDEELAAKIVNTWKNVGRIAMYRHPFTIGLTDLYLPDVKKQVEKMIEPLYVQDAGDKYVQVLKAVDEFIKQKAKELEEENDVFLMMQSGTKGDITQIRQLMVAPVFVQDTYGNIVRMPITRSYAEGATLSEYFASSFGARTGMLAKKLGIAEPGALNKEFLINTSSLVVTRTDDPDNFGIPLSLSLPDKDILNRILARDVTVNGKVIAKAGEAVTPNLLEKLRMENVQTIFVKSLLTDTNKDGIAATSYGLNEYGKLVKPDTNIGIIETQAITEPLSQATLNLFHTGSAGKTEESVTNILEEIKFYTRMPASKMEESAVLSLSAGTVRKIERLPTGGYNVVVDKTPHYVPADKKIIVSEGQFVRKGEPLTTGPIHPIQIMKLRGPNEARYQIAMRIVELLNKFGNPVSLQTVEPLVRGLMSTAVVVDPGPFKNIISEGEILPQQYIEKLNIKAGTKELPVEKAIGYKTADTYGTVFIGTLIDEDIVKELKRQGYKKVKVYEDKIKYSMITTGSLTQALYNPNWMHALSFGRIKSTLTTAAASGAEWNMAASKSPNAEWLMGTTNWES